MTMIWKQMVETMNRTQNVFAFFLILLFILPSLGLLFQQTLKHLMKSKVGGLTQLLTATKMEWATWLNYISIIQSF